MNKIKENKRNKDGNLTTEGVIWYRAKIAEMIDKIEDEQMLKRIYGLVEYLYIYK